MIVTTTGQPRSGTWWLTRLLSDLLDSPIKTLPPDNVTITDFCQTGQGDYTIYKTHLGAHEWDGKGKAVFIQRDPRDVAVSRMYYLRLEPTPENLYQVIKTMVDKNANPRYKMYHEMGVYENWVRGWLDKKSSNVYCTKYELLHAVPVGELSVMADNIGIGWLLMNEFMSTIYRQQFNQHKAKYSHSMRKGIAGDWKNHFDGQCGEFITYHLGQLMLENSYIDDLGWWKEL